MFAFHLARQRASGALFLRQGCRVTLIAPGFPEEELTQCRAHD